MGNKLGDGPDALLRAAARFRQDGMLFEELASYDDIVARFGQSHPAEAAEALLRKATRLDQLGHLQEAAALRDEILRQAEAGTKPGAPAALETAARYQQHLYERQMKQVSRSEAELRRATLMIWASIPFVAAMGIGLAVLGIWFAPILWFGGGTLYVMFMVRYRRQIAARIEKARCGGLSHVTLKDSPPPWPPPRPPKAPPATF